MSVHIAAVDCGTTCIKSAIFDLRGHTRGAGSRHTPCRRMPDGGVEVDSAALQTGCLAALRASLRDSGVRPGSVDALVIANQRATVFPLDRHGEPIGPGLSWQDLRGTQQVGALGRRIPSHAYFALTGLPPNPVFSIGKILWVRDRERAGFRAAARWALAQDLLLRHLGADDYACDRSNASMTGLLDVTSQDWSPEILAACGLSRERLPRLVSSGQRVGSLSARAAARTGLPAGLPLIAGGGDQQCAGVGAGAVEPGIVEVTIGTAAAALCYAPRPAFDRAMRVTCCAHAVPGRWELEGLQNSAGACLEWAAEIANAGRRFDDSFFRAASRVRPGAEGIRFIPYLGGASAPHWIPDASGALLGLKLGHGRPALVRAILEGVSFQTREIIDVFRALRVPVREVRLTGGGTAIDVWNRIQADIFGVPVLTLANPQATLLGAAILGACGIGAFPDVPAAARSMVRIRRRYEPDRARRAEYERLFARYREIHSGFERERLFSGARTERGRKP